MGEITQVRADGPLAARWEVFGKSLRVSECELRIVRLAYFYGALTMFHTLRDPDPVALHLLVAEIRKFEEELRSASGRRLDVGPDADGTSAARRDDDHCSPPTPANGDDNGQGAVRADGRDHAPEKRTRRPGRRERAGTAAPAQDVPRSDAPQQQAETG